jgi:hypothetical protein
MAGGIRIEKLCKVYDSALSSLGPLQIAVLINPLVYASEGCAATLAPQFPHMPTAVVLTVLRMADLGCWLSVFTTSMPNP